MSFAPQFSICIHQLTHSQVKTSRPHVPSNKIQYTYLNHGKMQDLTLLYTLSVSSYKGFSVDQGNPLKYMISLCLMLRRDNIANRC